MAFTGSLDEQFEQAQAALKTLSSDPGNELKLRIYALYKQATAGDASGKRPGFGDLMGRAKFDAWKKMSGSTPEAAKQAYVDTVDSLLG